MSQDDHLGVSFHEVLSGIGVRLVTAPKISGGTFECHVEVGPIDAPWRLRVEGLWPLTILPNVFLADRSQGVNLAHVSYCGQVCYTDREGEGFSPAVGDAPFVLANVIGRAEKVLEASAALRERNDFAELLAEFEGFWGSLPGCITVPIECNPCTNRLYARVSRKNQKWLLHGIDSGTTKQSGGQLIKVKLLTLKTPLLPPPPDQDWSKQWLDHLIDLAEQEGLKLRTPKLHVLLCKQPGNSGTESLFGVMYYGVVQNRKVFVYGNQLTPFCIQRSWREFLLRRVGGHNIRRRVAIIGCGSIGGRVADQLALAGIEDIVLVDPEKFNSENIFRHVLGEDSVGYFKVEKLEEELRKKRPGVRVTSRTEDAQKWLSRKAEREGCNTLVMATGNLALEREIVRRSRNETWGQRIISGWVEPLGLGGHTISSRHGERGCLECLHRDSGLPMAAPKTQFLTPGQKFSENLTGCAGSFTPYSNSAATKTAQMIVDMVLSDDHGYRCWTGTDSYVLEKDMSTTAWYEKCASERMDGRGVRFSEKGCPCCDT